MDQDFLVSSRFKDGERLLSLLVQAGFDITVAFWVLTAEDPTWLLYIGSNSVDPERVGDAYRTLYTCLAKIPDAAVSFSEVRLVHPSDPTAVDAIAERDRQLARIRWARLPVGYHGKRLGNLLVEEAYFYPAKIGPMTRDEAVDTVKELLMRGGQAHPSVFTFADGSTKQAIPTGMHLYMAGPARGLRFELFDPVTGQKEDVAADKVINIQ